MYFQSRNPGRSLGPPTALDFNYPQGAAYVMQQAGPAMTDLRPTIIDEADDEDASQQMQSQQQQQHHHTQYKPLTFGPTDNSESTSTSLSDIIDGLPTAVKSSLGPLRTIRRSVSIRGWASYFYEITANSTTTMGANISHEEASEQHHHTMVSTSRTTAVELQEQHHRQQQHHIAQAYQTTMQPHQSNHGERRRTKSTRQIVPYVEPERTRIDQFCGLQGQLLVNSALSENRQGVRDGEIKERRAYVQGLAWLLQGLPDDLNERERTDLLHSMPPSLIGQINNPHRLCLEARRRSLIHRAVTALVLQLVAPLQILWGFFLTFLTFCVRLERRYGLGEQIVRHAVDVGYALGKTGVRMSGKVYSNGGAKAVATVTGAVAYVADGVVKGVSDGVREAWLEVQQTDGQQRREWDRI